MLASNGGKGTDPHQQFAVAGYQHDPVLRRAIASPSANGAVYRADEVQCMSPAAVTSQVDEPRPLTANRFWARQRYLRADVA